MYEFGKVLVVDDEGANASLLERLLTVAAYREYIARDGESALQVVARESPDLLVLDVVMPDLNGFDACRQLKRDPRTRLLPIVLVTGLQNRQERVNGISRSAPEPGRASEVTLRASVATRFPIEVLGSSKGVDRALGASFLGKPRAHGPD